MSKKFNLENILNDQRIIKAKELIRETIQEYQETFLSKKNN